MNQLMKLWNMLDGRKTMIGIAAGTAYSVLIYFNVLPDNMLVWSVIGAWTGISYRLAIKKI